MPSAPNKVKKGSISVRIAFLFCTTFAIGLAFAFVVTYAELRYSLEKSDREILTAKMQEMKSIFNNEGLNGLTKFLAVEKNQIMNADYLIRLLKEDFTTLYMKPSVQEKTYDFEKAFATKSLSKPKLGWHDLEAIDDEDTFNLLTEKVAPDIYLEVGKSSEDRDNILEQILINFAIMEFILVILSAALGFWYARKSLAPVRTLLSTMRIIEAGELSERVPVENTNDELQDLGDTFNRMVNRIEKLIQETRESLDNVAHEIRTPLTRIRIVAEEALVANQPDLLRTALEDCTESASNISELVDQLFNISEAQAGTLKLNYETCDIKLLIEEVVEIYEFIAQEKNIEFEFGDIPENFMWNTDRKRLKQVIANLIDNAIKFSKNDSVVTVNCSATDTELKISIIDHGPGISSTDLPKIWDRLYRGDKSRTTQGLGLGLAIVQAIVNALGGKYSAENGKLDGMIFSIYLPHKPTL